MPNRGEALGSSSGIAPTYPLAASASIAGSSSTSLCAFSWTPRPLSVKSVQGENSTAAATRLLSRKLASVARVRPPRGFMAYGPDLPRVYRRGAEYVDLILHGARPADLPVEQPDKFKLILNLKTAKLLGIDIPPTLLARADEVIE
jgi:hypothetical protein